LIYNKFYLDNKEISNNDYTKIILKGKLGYYDMKEISPDEIHLTTNIQKQKNLECKDKLLNEYNALKNEIIKVKEHIEQSNYGMPRDDYEQNLKRFKEIILRLREIEQDLN
jgi:hypothetical protein